MYKNANKKSYEVFDRGTSKSLKTFLQKNEFASAHYKNIVKVNV